MTDTFKLSTGLYINGKWHTKITIRETTMEDLLLSEEDAKAKPDSVLYHAICTITKSIVSLGDIEKEKIIPELIMKLTEADLELVQNRREQLKKNAPSSYQNE